MLKLAGGVLAGAAAAAAGALIATDHPHAAAAHSRPAHSVAATPAPTLQGARVAALFTGEVVDLRVTPRPRRTHHRAAHHAAARPRTTASTPRTTASSPAPATTSPSYVSPTVSSVQVIPDTTSVHRLTAKHRSRSSSGTTTIG